MVPDTTINTEVMTQRGTADEAAADLADELMHRLTGGRVGTGSRGKEEDEQVKTRQPISLFTKYICMFKKVI